MGWDAGGYTVRSVCRGLSDVLMSVANPQIEIGRDSLQSEYHSVALKQQLQRRRLRISWDIGDSWVTAAWEQHTPLGHNAIGFYWISCVISLPSCPWEKEWYQWLGNIGLLYELIIWLSWKTWMVFLVNVYFYLDLNARSECKKMTSILPTPAFY